MKDAGWAETGLDRFVLAKLEAKGLQARPPADRYALLRRATYDLTGLPPTPEEIDAFLDDDSPEAFERVVDRLLASREFGDHWGRHWLDGVRYADATSIRCGPYRDWVVRAFNADLPYDRFVRDAARRRPAPGRRRPTRRRSTSAAPRSTACRRPGCWPWRCGSRWPATWRWPRSSTARSTSWAGNCSALTLACARCHDHKFDPFSDEDYYGLAGIFFSAATSAPAS